MDFKRYQLNKDAVRIVRSKHPWIFRKHLSSAASILKTGDFVELFDSENAIVGHGIYDEDGLIAIRVFNFSRNRPDDDSFGKKLTAALSKRENLRKYTDAFRLCHGENDGIPGVVIDIYGKHGVLQTYSQGVDGIGRRVGELAQEQLQLESLVWKMPVKRKDRTEKSPVQILKGDVPKPFSFKEGKLDIWVDLEEGQKSGLFLDLRGLRKFLASGETRGKRVLNLFSYTGTLGLAAEIGGATEVWNVDISKGALETAKSHHTLNRDKHKFIAADVFDWFKKLEEGRKFDLIIVDPPMMAAETSQVPGALRAYRQLYRSALAHLAPKGTIAACCCTSRIPRSIFEKEVAKSLSPYLKLKKSLPPEDDHPVAFPEGDYLKVLIFKA